MVRGGQDEGEDETREENGIEVGGGVKAKIVTNGGRDPSFDSAPLKKIAFVAGSLWARNKIRFRQKSALGLLPPDQILC